MRIILTVIDSFGIGAMPDAAEYGDLGSDTYGNIVFQTGISLTEMIALGLNNIDGVAKVFDNGKAIKAIAAPLAAYGRLAELSPAKDTTAGHYEIAGLVLEKPFRIYKTFPPDVVRDIENAAGVKFIGNEIASGTEIIQRLGEEHLRSGKPILYTSQDSVLQIAADISVIPLPRLYQICETARKIMVGDRAVGRIIARPFTHKGGKFIRTEDRKDYALEPPGITILDELHGRGIPVYAVGKIRDIFCGRGIDESVHTGNNAEGLCAINALIKKDIEGLIFANLVDTDMLYGHRNDVKGYAKALKEIDGKLPEILEALKEDDILIITADHGCDPSTPSTDHSREYVPLLIYGQKVTPKNLGTLQGFNHIADFIAAAFGLREDKAVFERIVRR